ncbi:glycoside hydrolase family 16 protein [Fistulina hepatica ATCC 64428]|uniref:Glycoside hydrolase family 16 protein n=1 Tax=Fistulina hepatica ATCC 64428 TaxID=1128425 RepID=A0A0D7AMZ2_9AGAR|nr:glycoside hydrolase family 16 protein [Fistulina hepatica ATCC 64428]
MRPPSLGDPAGQTVEGHRSGRGQGSTSTHSLSIPGSPLVFRNTFASPPTRPISVSIQAEPTGIRSRQTFRSAPRPRSTMMSDADVIEKPWTTKGEPFSRIAYLITYSVACLGIAAGAIRCYFGWKSVNLITGNLCLVLDESFANGGDGLFGENATFFREVDMSGFGNGEFEMTTNSSNNSFVRDGMLYIYPTLTSDEIGSDAIFNGYTYNITGCTEAYWTACSAVSNSTSGTVINPIQSARLTTRYSASIRYGRVEVRAKIPKGEWLWPAIWMMPVDSVYGAWPASGEIDIMEARGNGIRYEYQGRNYVRGTLNWGPTSTLNSGWRTYGYWQSRPKTYDEGFHIFSLEWTEDFIRIYVDTRLHAMLDLTIGESFWDRGDYATTYQNGSETVALTDPWVNGTKAAPFDQEFYLILDVGVGGTNGWFPDGDGKPWIDASTTAMRSFAEAQDKWYPTWPTGDDRALIIDYVKMWQLSSDACSV